MNKNSSEMEVMEINSDDEEIGGDENDKEKSKWKEDKLLTFKVTDSEAEEEKIQKSQENKKKSRKADDEDDR